MERHDKLFIPNDKTKEQIIAKNRWEGIKISTDRHTWIDKTTLEERHNVIVMSEEELETFTLDFIENLFSNDGKSSEELYREFLKQKLTKV